MNDCLSKLLTTGDHNCYFICVNNLLGLQAQKISPTLNNFFYLLEPIAVFLYKKINFM